MNLEFADSNWVMYAVLISTALLLGFCLMFIRDKSNRSISNFFGMALKIAAALCLALSLASPYTHRSSEYMTTAVLLDISDSVDEGAAQQLFAITQGFASAEHLIEYIPFASGAPTFSVNSGDVRSYTQVKRAWSKLDIGNTDLEKALRSAAQIGISNILLVSDGYETAGDALRAISSISAGGMRIYPLLPEDPRGSEEAFRVSQLYAPLVAPAKKSVDVRVSILNTTSRPQSGILDILHEGKSVFRKRVRVDAGKEALAIAASDPSMEGIKEITAKLTPDDAVLPQSAQTTYLSGEEREKILLVGSDAAEQKLLSSLLKDQMYEVKSVEAEGGRAELPPLADYSVLILNNIELGALPHDAPETIRNFAAAGGGFIMIGGNKSYGLGGYKDTIIEDILPVEMVPPQTVKKRLSIAVELVLDKSRSMSQGDKMGFAKEAAREAIRTLKDEDYIGVIGFDAAPFVVVKLGKLAENREQALEGVNRLFPTGKTNLLPAIDEARRSLVRVNAGRKHMIILTDGQLPDAGPFYLELVKHLRSLGITVSTVMLGSEVDIDLLREMAELGGGGFYQTVDPRALPKIFLSDIKVTTGERTMKEDEEFVVRQTQAGVVSTSIKTFPPVRGYVQTKPKGGADLELVAYGSERAEPLLASWDYKKGRTLAFTSDISGRWTKYWVSWPKLQQFWSDVLDAVRPKNGEAQENLKFDLRYYVERGTLTFDLTVFSEISASNVQAAVTLPDGTSSQVDFKNISRGRYAASIEGARAGKYEVRASAGTRTLTPIAFNLSGELFGEQKGRGFNVPFLSALASETGGVINPSAEQLSARAQKRVEKKELTWAFLLVALICLCLETLRREVWRSSRFYWRKTDANLGRVRFKA